MGDIKRRYTVDLTDFQAAMLADAIADAAQHHTWLGEEMEVLASVFGTQPTEPDASASDGASP